MQVSIQEFKSHLSRYVAEAQSGNLIEITSYRKVEVRIVGVPLVESVGVTNLLSAGMAAWQAGKPTGASLSLQKRGKSVSAMVLEDRR